ncbi:MAG: MFS transporter [Alphaproteobacteria bacterium]|nr:MFS transporter [Alphaproteobacteria bacterium]
MTLFGARLAQGFSLVGHAYMHLLVALFLTIVLALERGWGMAYAELISLWTIGALLVGLIAPLAGFLGDKWSTPGMMVVFFIGAGVSTIACGLADGPLALGIALGGLGLFAAIYHPVGMAWLVRSSVNRGMALGVFGVFGSGGLAIAGIMAAFLIDEHDWRVAFILPGALSLATGLALLACMITGIIVDDRTDRSSHGAPPPAAEMFRAFFVLSLTVFFGGLIYQGTQVAMPKVLTLRLPGIEEGGVLAIGALFTMIYLIGGLMQLVGGWLADHYPLKWVYLWTYVFQVPLLYSAAALSGLPFIVIVVAMVVLNAGSLPAENCLLARYTPARWRGSAFGAKFVLSLGVAPVAVQLVSWIQGTTGGFFWLFAVLSGAAVMVVISILLLPGEAGELAPEPVAGAAE